MGGVAKLFSPPKPKKDKEAEKRLEEQERLEAARRDSADRALMASRRARLAGGARGRSGLSYVAPSGPGSTLG